MRGTMKSLGFCLLSTALVAGATSAMAAECGPLQMVTSIPMKPIVGGIPGIDVQIADTRQTLLVDTGGVFSAVTKRTVRELKLKPTQSNVGITNVRGQKSDQAVRLPSIALGTLRQEGAYFQVDPAPDDLDDKSPKSFAGTLGPDLLQKFDADFDFASGKLNLISPDHCQGKVVYWTRARNRHRAYARRAIWPCSLCHDFGGQTGQRAPGHRREQYNEESRCGSAHLQCRSERSGG